MRGRSAARRRAPPGAASWRGRSGPAWCSRVCRKSQSQRIRTVSKDQEGMKEPTPTAEDTQLSLQATNTRISVDHSLYMQSRIKYQKKGEQICKIHRIKSEDPDFAFSSLVIIKSGNKEIGASIFYHLKQKKFASSKQRKHVNQPSYILQK